MRTACLLTALAASMTFGQEARNVNGIAFEVRHVQGNVYLFASTLGNVAIQVGKDAGHDGVLLVDTGPEQLRELILAEIRKLSNEPIRFMIVTGPDADHNGSNAALLKPASSRNYQTQADIALFAQDNVLQRFSREGSGVPSEAPGRRSHFWTRKASRSMEKRFRCSPKRTRTPMATASCSFAART